MHEKPTTKERAKHYEKHKVKERAIVKEKTHQGERKGGKMKQFDPLPALIDAALAIEKPRVASEVRQKHFANQGKKDSETDELHRRLVDLETYVDARVATLIKAHPAYPWFSRVKGVGKENIGKVVGLIDIEKDDTVSSLWKFAGFAPVDGKAEKRQRGTKLQYNSQLRSTCWRLGTSLLKARGKFYEYYLREKERYLTKYASQGIRVIPTPAGRYCPTCLVEVEAKARKYCPTCGSLLSKKQEPEGVIFEGHVHNQAVRKMIKLFLALLWDSWREAEGLPTRVPYPAEYLGHNHIIKPEEMVDKSAKKRR